MRQEGEKKMIKLLVFLIRLSMLVVSGLIGWLCIILSLVLWDGWYMEMASKIYDRVNPWGDK